MLLATLPNMHMTHTHTTHPRNTHDTQTLPASFSMKTLTKDPLAAAVSTNKNAVATEFFYSHHTFTHMVRDCLCAVVCWEGWSNTGGSQGGRCARVFSTASTHSHMRC